MKRYLALLLALVMLSGLLVGCATTPATPEPTAPAEEPAAPDTTAEGTEPEPVDPEAGRYGGKLTVDYTSCGATLDPMKTTGWGMYNWTTCVFETAIAKDAEEKFAPGVCDYELSDDMLTLKLTVREGVTFHDGSAVEIEDVLASIERAGQLVSRIKKDYMPYVESQTIEGDVLTIKFTEYNLASLYYLASNQPWACIMPKEICEKYGTDDAIVTVEDCIGTGPYKVVSVNLGDKVVLERYDGYVPVAAGRTGLAAPKMAYMDQITFQTEGEYAAEAMAMTNGEVDVLRQEPEYDTFFTGTTVKTESDRNQKFNYFVFNAANETRIVRDKNVRKAIAAALDFDELRIAWLGEADYVLTCEQADMVNGLYSSPKTIGADYMGGSKMDLAKEYLAASSYNGEEIIFVVADSDDASKAEALIAPKMKELGVNFKTELMDPSVQQEFISSPDNAWDIQWNMSTTVAAPFRVSSNIMGTYWASAERDALMEECNKFAVGTAESVAAWAKIDELFAEECPLFIYGGLKGNNFFMNGDLNWNGGGDTEYRFWYNCYWTNPDQH